MTGAGREIERKFLVPEPPADLDACPSTSIDQGYVAIAADGTEVRIRRRDGDATLTIKSGPGRSRLEEELEIDDERFVRLWPLTAGRRIQKRRHLVEADGGHTIEVDVYTGHLAGLVVAEVEFASEEAADAWAPPAWFGPEVTEDARYKNQSLAVHGIPPAP